MRIDEDLFCVFFFTSLRCRQYQLEKKTAEKNPEDMYDVVSFIYYVDFFPMRAVYMLSIFTRESDNSI